METSAQAIGVAVRGTFHRAVDPRFRDAALAGSRTAGRYSRADQPTLYCSSSVEGVRAAMQAHRGARPAEPTIVALDVDAARVVDLRDPSARAAAAIELSDASAPWQDVVADGGVPRSWLVRDRLEALGADGLIDPSRTEPGRWHLVLFRWNVEGAPQVHLRGTAAEG